MFGSMFRPLQGRLPDRDGYTFGDIAPPNPSQPYPHRILNTPMDIPTIREQEVSELQRLYCQDHPEYHFDSPEPRAGGSPSLTFLQCQVLILNRAKRPHPKHVVTMLDLLIEQERIKFFFWLKEYGYENVCELEYAFAGRGRSRHDRWVLYLEVSYEFHSDSTILFLGQAKGVRQRLAWERRQRELERLDARVAVEITAAEDHALGEYQRGQAERMGLLNIDAFINGDERRGHGSSSDSSHSSDDENGQNHPEDHQSVEEATVAVDELFHHRSNSPVPFNDHFPIRSMRSQGQAFHMFGRFLVPDRGPDIWSDDVEDDDEDEQDEDDDWHGGHAGLFGVRGGDGTDDGGIYDDDSSDDEYSDRSNTIRLLRELIEGESDGDDDVELDDDSEIGGYDSDDDCIVM